MGLKTNLETTMVRRKNNQNMKVVLFVAMSLILAIPFHLGHAGMCIIPNVFEDGWKSMTHVAIAEKISYV